MLATNDEWALARRYMSLETLARITINPTIRLPVMAACLNSDLSEGRSSCAEAQDMTCAGGAIVADHE